MPTLQATDSDLRIVEAFLKRYQLDHLHARKRADAITLDAGTKADPWPRARARRVTTQWWTLDMADHYGRWELTPFRAPLIELLDLLADNFPWILANAG
jgi:hypothetical protein